jgi:hypothetical protein
LVCARSKHSRLYSVKCLDVAQEKKEKKGKWRNGTPTHKTRPRHCLYSATTNDPTSSSLARLAGLGLAYLLALLTGYIIQYPISQSARLLFSI